LRSALGAKMKRKRLEDKSGDCQERESRRSERNLG
jgi:hypothetical protein